MRMKAKRSGDASSGEVDVAAAWRELGARLRAWAARRVDPADADDIAQSAMLRLLERRDEVEAGSVAAWLFAVTRNAVADHYRRKTNAFALDASGEPPDLRASELTDDALGELSDCIEPMLGALSAADADVLRRVDLEGEPQVALAARLGVAPSTLKSRVQRARAKLRAALDACCHIERGRDGAPVGVERGASCAPEACDPGTAAAANRRG